MIWNSNDKPRFEEKISITVILLILISISISALGHEPKADPEPLALEMDGSDPEYEDIDPIKVEDEDEFSEDHWIGKGTEEEPYELKKNYSINATGHEYGIKIVGIDAHFIIENVEIYGASGETGAGIHLYYTLNGKLIDCHLYDNDAGIYAEGGGSLYVNIIEENHIINNQYGLFYDKASGDLIKNNVISNNTESGFYGDDRVKYNEIINNTLSNNGGSGIKLENLCPYNLIQGNEILGNDGNGIHLSNNAGENQITENKIENNDLGISIEGDSNNNEIWRNQFIDNTDQAIDKDDNLWNRSDPEDGGEGGNYWSDWEDQEINDRGDGVGDAPYVIGESNQDNCPWVTSDMSLNSVDRFEVSVENTTAGEYPTIEISKAYDEGDYLLEGEYSVNLDINGEVLKEDLVFEVGNAEYTYKELNETDEYSVQVTIEGVVESTTFFIEASGPEYISIEPEENQTIKAGKSLNFYVDIYDEYENLITDDPEDFNWENASEGKFTNTTAGNYKVFAIYKEDETFTTEPVNVTVVVDDVQSIELETPSETNITAGKTLEFRAKVYDNYDNLITDDPDDFNWENASNGKFNNTNPGEYEVFAIYKENETFTTEPVNVTVNTAQVNSIELEIPFETNITAGETPEFKAKVYDEYNNLITDDPENFIWHNASNGKFTNTTAGNYEVFAVYKENETFTTKPVNVTVNTAEVHSIELETSSETNITAGEVIEFKAKVYDEYNNLITNDPENFIWHNASKGKFINTTAGEYKVTATFEEGISQYINVTVKASQVQSIELETSSETNITAGETIDFIAKAYDPYNNLITEDPNDFVWENASNGEFTNTTAGEYKVTAAFEGKVVSEPEIVTVRKADAGFVELEPPSEIKITAGETIDFVAKAYDYHNNLITEDPNDFIWENAPKGEFTNTTAGEYKVTATFEEKESIVSEPCNVVVEADEAHSVRLEALSDTNITAGEVIEFTAEVYDTHDNLITKMAEDFIWNNASNGKFNETTMGEYEVTATYQGKENITSKSTNVIVKASQVDSIELKSPTKTNITAGETLEFTIQAYDEYNNLITDDPNDFLWKNASDGMFSVTNAGEYEVTAIFEGEENIISAPSQVVVTPAEVHSVKLEITSETNITAGEEVSFQPKAHDRYGNLVTNDPQDFTWENTSNGTFNETTVGEYEVKVIYEGKETLSSKPINLSVKANQAHSVELEDPLTTTLRPGDVLEFDAKAYDQYHNLIEKDDENFTWKNASNGTFKETTAGEYEIKATYHSEEGKVTSEGITVVVKTADLYEFDLIVEDITAGHRPEIEVVYIRDSFGNHLEGEYEIEVTIDGKTKTENLTFNEGSSHYYWEEITLAEQYSIELNINGINRSKNFQVTPGSPSSIGIGHHNETVVAGNSVNYTSIAYDEWNNIIGDVSFQTEWSIEKGAGGNWNGSEYGSENHGTWNITAVYNEGNKDLTYEYTLTVLPRVEGFRYSGLNTIIFEQNIDYDLEWNLSQNHVISYYEVMASKSYDELETIDTKTKNESYLYQFEDGDIVHFKIIGRDEKGEEVESIDFKVTVDLIKLEVEEREKKIFSINILEERKDGVNVTWFIDGEIKETGEVFIPDLEPGKYNITAEISGQEHVAELTYELHIEGEESEEGLSRIYFIIISALLLFGIGSVVHMRNKKEGPEDEFHFHEERKSTNNKLDREKSGIKSISRSTKSDKKPIPPPPPGLTTQSNEKNIDSNDGQEGIDNEIVIQTFEDIVKATKQEVYAELTGRSSEVIKVEKLEDKIESLVQEEKLTMQPRKDGDTLYIWNDLKSQLN